MKSKWVGGHNDVVEKEKRKRKRKRKNRERRPPKCYVMKKSLARREREVSGLA